MSRISTTIILTSILMAGSVFAGSDPIQSRQQLMEDTRDAAKVIGGMLKGEQPFDAEAAMAAFEVWKNTTAKAGELFPVGSETGFETEARMTIWTDRDGFNEALENFTIGVDAAIVASPGSVEALKQAAGPVFKACKGCHEGYRVEKEK